jgi:hypothetical protein
MVCAAVFLGSIPRMLLGVAADRSLASIAVYGAVYGKVMGLAGKTFVRPSG